MEGNAEEAILGAVVPAVFVNDVVTFAAVATRRLRRDWKGFRKDHACGAFDFTRLE
jgi:hypothetical protein